MTALAEIDTSDSLRVTFYQPESFESLWVTFFQPLGLITKIMRGFVSGKIGVKNERPWNVPLSNPREVSLERGSRSETFIFKLNSKTPLCSNDHVQVLKCNRESYLIRYISANKPSWCFRINNLIHHRGEDDLSLIPTIWIMNQKRRDMLAYMIKLTKEVYLLSLRSRKILRKPSFAKSMKNFSCYKIQQGPPELLLSPSFGLHPILVLKYGDQFKFFGSDFGGQLNYESSLNLQDRRLLKNDRFQDDRIRR